MQLTKYMEEAVMLSVSFFCATFTLLPAAPGNGAQAEHASAPESEARIDALTPMPVVRVVGHRPTQDEKRTSADRPG